MYNEQNSTAQRQNKKTILACIIGIIVLIAAVIAAILVTKQVTYDTAYESAFQEGIAYADSSQESVQEKLGLLAEWQESSEPLNLYDPAVDANAPIKVHVLHLGDCRVDEANIFADVVKSTNPLAPYRVNRDSKFDVTIPATAYLIEHPKGLILIDTGFNSTVRTDPVAELTELHAQINPPMQDEGDAIDEMLASMGIQPEDIDYVVLSHMHTDHTSGLQLVKNAKNILVCDKELAAAQTNTKAYVSHMWEDIDLQTFTLTKSEYGPTGMSFDLFGDGSVIFFELPGHTPGLVGTMINNNGKSLILTADCGYERISWEQMILPAVVTTREEMSDSFIWINQMAKQENVIECLCNHEKLLNTREYIF